MKFITEGTGTEEIKQWMALYFSGNFQVFKEDLALWVALVYNTWYNNSQYNNAQFMIYKLYIFPCITLIHIYIIYISLHDIDTAYIPKYSMK